MDKLEDTLTHEKIQARMVAMFGEKGVYQCAIHGEHDGWMNNHGCPCCVDEKRKAQDLADAKARRLAAQAQRWKTAGMPSKFCGIRLDDWQAMSDEQKAVKEVAQSFARKGVKRLLLMGNCGTGKTMLAAGIIGEMTAKGGCSPVYITASRLMRSIRDTWGNKHSEQQMMDKFIAADVLVIDELGAGRCTEDDKLMLSEILCDRYSADMPTLLISNLDGQQLKEKVLDERAVDRMREGGVVKAMKWQSYRGLKAATPETRRTFGKEVGAHG